MVSYRLIQRIEENWQRLAHAVLLDLQKDPRTPHYHGMPDEEILDRAHDLVRNLGYWLTQGDFKELSGRYERIGVTRAVQGIPLHEVLRKLQLMKRRLMLFAHDQTLDHSAIEIRAENELHLAIDQFFDEVIYSIAKGHESRTRAQAA
ncbi:MAG: hypothetical protein JNL98_19170 [Bryobacterales bacterium]|nr:hypothetical protein [Bryobacterales bacterium]